METPHIDQKGINVVMLDRLCHRKSLDAIPQDAAQSEHQLRWALGPLQLTLLGIGAIIGWDLIIEYAVGNIAVAIGGAAGFQRRLLGQDALGQMRGSPASGVRSPESGLTVFLFAFSPAGFGESWTKGLSPSFLCPAAH